MSETCIGFWAIAGARIVLKTAANFGFLTLLDTIQSKILNIRDNMHHWQSTL
ncbi:hypothetical protein IQ270_17835 [Microcoleus sp. LEGE 07076]|uniref:hypothetical protein n=1 Tax=Microcoleus sp. LEGE 07076 TaxID=915322 RepID=UPI001880C9D1|nr:hypothetical protein [Microcoleus sp. LEGE 07076]MBE9186494.1 hypothetical protein [Microcoleus sp. LEGE 07076]